MFDRQRGEVGVGGQVACYAKRLQQAPQGCGMRVGRLDDRGDRLGEPFVNVLEGITGIERSLTRSSNSAIRSGYGPV